jgi:hypothetical protein
MEHDLGDLFEHRVLLDEGGEGVRPRQHAHEPPAVQDGEVLLETRCDAARRLGQQLVGRECAEVRDHRPVDCSYSTGDPSH